MNRTQSLAAATAIAVAGVASAGVVAPTEFSVNSLTTSGTGTIEDFTIDPYVFGSTDFLDFTSDNGLPDGFFIEVTSGVSDRIGFDFEVIFNYSEYDIGFFEPNGTHSLTLTDLYDDPGIQILDVFAKTASGDSIGSISTDGENIVFDAPVADILAAIGAGEDLPITIQFAIPAPGAVALLGMAGLAGGRRRRR